VGIIKTYDSERREGEEAARIIKSSIGTLLVDDEEGERPLKYSDIAILVPTRKGFNQYEDGLRNADIPFQVYKGKGFFERQEVSDVLNLLTFLVNPNDDLALASLLKGPFFGLSDEDLMRISKQKGAGLLLKLGAAPGHERDHDLIKKFITIAWTLPPHIALRSILELSVVYATVGGKREARNLDRVVEWAIEESSSNSILELAERLRRLVEEPPKEGEPPLTLHEDSVTMMTIHSAKGLEWPMVLVLGMNHEGGGSFYPPYLLDPDNGISLKVADHRTGDLVKPPSWIKAEEDAALKEVQERKRLLYVACTRAKDHLVLSGAVPVRKDGVELDPHGMFKLLWESMDLSISELDEGMKVINGVNVQLVPVRPDDISEADDEEEEPIELYSAESGPKLPFLRGLEPKGHSFLLSPSKLLEKSDPRGIPSEYPMIRSGIPPDEFGDMVHAVLQGIPMERVLREAGREEFRDQVINAAGSIRRNMDDLGLDLKLHEVEIVSSLVDGNGEEVPLLGRMDLFGKTVDGYHIIIDFKTGARKASHAEQLEIYRQMVNASVEGEVRTRVVYTEGIDDP
jgi:ATP-dependent helicase/nuclease subunit A